MIDKISKLLALAERAGTPAEAEACFAKAQALATAHAISLAEARLAHPDEKANEKPTHRTITIGEPRKRANKHLVSLMSAITRVNDVELNIAHNSTYVILFGFPSDINTCEELWIRISHQMVQFAERYLAGDEWRNERILDASGYNVLNVTKQTARSSYYAGFIQSLAVRLNDARQQEVARAEQRGAAEAAATNRSTSGTARAGAGQKEDSPGSENRAAVAIRAKSEDVRAYYAKESRARGVWRGNQRATQHSRTAARAGRRDGHLVRIGSQDQLPGPRVPISE